VTELEEAPFRGQPPAHVDPAATYDLLWRKQPVRMGFMQMARATPAIAAAMATKIPGEFWAQVATGVVQVSCPCGKAPQVEWNLLRVCECNRVYVYIGGNVRVGYAEGYES
jgi:hypothetical protein